MCQPTCLASAAPSNAVGRDPATSGWSDWQLTELTVDPPMPKMGTLWGPIVRTDVKAKTTLSAPLFHSICTPLEIYFCHTFSCIHPSVYALKICWLNGCHQDIFCHQSELKTKLTAILNWRPLGGWVAQSWFGPKTTGGGRRTSCHPHFVYLNPGHLCALPTLAFIPPCTLKPPTSQCSGLQPTCH